MRKQTEQDESRRDYSILFADIKGFSHFEPFQQKLYIKKVLNQIAEALYGGDHCPEQANTWGDGIIAFFSSHTKAVRCALTLRDTFRNTPWEEDGLPPLKIRIALHIGEVFVGYNPVRHENELIGTEINRAARLEPVVAPNHVYATKDFVQLCKLKDVQFKSLGKIVLAKSWETEEIYIVLRGHESFDPNNSIKSPILDAPKNILPYSLTSKFGSRLSSVSCDAKSAIADYCTKPESNFWKSEDVVFIESGTLPVFMVLALYRRCDSMMRPKLLITNNLACSTIIMMAEQSENESHILYPEDEPSNSILIGGRILADYAATIPEDLFEKDEGGFWQSDKIVEYFNHKGVSHIIMMCSKLTKTDGPCAVSLSMRRFKKLLLRYVVENPEVRISILAEAEKLVGRRGQPADAVDLPGSEDAHYWENLLRSGRVTIISAISSEMSSAEVGLAKREMRALHKAGASCILLEMNGKVVELNKKMDVGNYV